MQARRRAQPSATNSPSSSHRMPRMRRSPVRCSLCGRQGGARARAPCGEAARGAERPARARPWRRGSPGPVPNPEAKPAIAESTAAPAAGGQDVALAQGASRAEGPRGAPFSCARGAGCAFRVRLSSHRLRGGANGKPLPGLLLFEGFLWQTRTPGCGKRFAGEGDIPRSSVLL